MQLFTLTYDRGRYRQLLHYARKLDLPISQADQAWAAEIAAAAQ